MQNWRGVLFCYNGGLLGKRVLVSLKRIVPNNAKKLKKGDKLKAVIVTASNIRKEFISGVEAKSKRNSIVILKKGDDWLPMGSRVTRRVAKNVRYNGFLRLALVSRGLF